MTNMRSDFQLKVVCCQQEFCVLFCFFFPEGGWGAWLIMRVHLMQVAGQVCCYIKLRSEFASCIFQPWWLWWEIEECWVTSCPPVEASNRDAQPHIKLLFNLLIQLWWEEDQEQHNGMPLTRYLFLATRTMTFHWRATSALKIWN